MNAEANVVRCEKCARVIAQRDNVKRDGWVIRTPIVTVSDDGREVRVKCKNCKEMTAVPLIAKSFSPIVVRRKHLTQT